MKDNQTNQVQATPSVDTPEVNMPTEENLGSKSSSKNKSVVLILVLLLLGLLALLVYLFNQNTQLKKQVELMELEKPVAVTCEYEGTTYEVGEGFTASDGCNSCSCSENGEVACTLMACADEENQVQADPTAEWETYASNGYSFKHPEGLKSDSDAAGSGVESIRVTYVGPEQVASGRIETSLFDGYMFVVTKIGSGPSKTMQQQAQEDRANSEDFCDFDQSVVSPISQAQVAGINAYQYSTMNCMGDSTESYLVNNNNLYRITQMYTGEELEKLEYKEITDQILNTFKFTE